MRGPSGPKSADAPFSEFTAGGPCPPFSLGKKELERRYWPFVVPAGAIILAVIVFPWVFTVFMSTQEWAYDGSSRYVGLSNYTELLRVPASPRRSS